MRKGFFFLLLLGNLGILEVPGVSDPDGRTALAAPSSLFLEAVWVQVGEEEVTVWDVAVAQALGLVDPSPWRGRPVQQLVDRILLLREARKFQITPEGIPDLEVQAFLGRLGQRLGQETLQQRLRRLDLDGKTLEAWVRNYLAEQRFLDLRIRSLILILPQEVSKAYQRRAQAYPGRSREAVEALLRKELEEQAYQKRLLAYLKELRDRATIRWILPPEATPEGLEVGSLSVQ